MERRGREAANNGPPEREGVYGWSSGKDTGKWLMCVATHYIPWIPEILNLGKYERQHYIGINPDLREEDKQKQIAQKEKDFVAMILGAYKAEPFDGFKTFHGKKNSRLVAIGPINLPVSRLFVEAVIKES